jgi:two-component system LytT family response regulator
MNKIRTLLVDDEPLARQRIRLLSLKEPDLEILAECSSGAEALAAIRLDPPDLLFLDVQMPEMDGFTLLDAIPPRQMPAVIFVTAFDRHAVKAFEVHALDYLLKPFTTVRFREMVQHAREQLATRSDHAARARAFREPAARHPGEGNYQTRLSVRTPDRIVFLKTGQIDYIESAGNYVAVQVGRDTHIVRDTLSALEGRLDPEQFLRISRSVLVNLDAIKELQPHFQGQHIVVLHNGKRLTMSRGLREVEQALNFSQPTARRNPAQAETSRS